MSARWGTYVERRLGELERGEGDFSDLRQPTAAAVARARTTAAATFREQTPTPSVVPSADGEVLFVWHKNGLDAEISVSESEPAEIWIHDRRRDSSWSGALGDHIGCCVKRLLDDLETPEAASRPSRP